MGLAALHNGRSGRRLDRRLDLAKKAFWDNPPALYKIKRTSGRLSSHRGAQASNPLGGQENVAIYRPRAPLPAYLFVCAGAVALGVVVTDIETLP
jgi:hypothetical protein